MKIRHCLWLFSALFVLLGALSPLKANADSLYIGDTDNPINPISTIKRFDATTGAFIDTFVSSGSGGLSGPTGILFVDGNIVVASQNPLLKISGGILQYNGSTGQFINSLVPSSSKYAPFAPRGIILGDKLYVADLTISSGISSGRIRTYTKDGQFQGDINLGNAIKNKDSHPRGIVFGPGPSSDLLYVSVRDLNKTDGLGGYVLRFNPDGSFVDVFIADDGGPGQLNRPEGLVFGPNGKLYITSFRATTTDTDSIRVYNSDGTFDHKIDLDTVNGSRAYAQALLFGPNGCLFVPITNTGEVRRYNVGGGQCDAVQMDHYQTFISAGGNLGVPWYLTFGKTNPKTLEYEED